MTPYDPFISYPLIVAKYSTPKNKVFSLYYNASPFLWLYIILILNSKEYENLITFLKYPVTYYIRSINHQRKHSRPENLKKVQAKILVKSNKSKNFFSWNCIFGSFKLFPSSKIDFWPFLKLQQKWNLVKKICDIDSFYITVFFLAWTFFNFLAHCVVTLCKLV